MATTNRKDKPNNKNLKALFSVICLCIIALGLIVYFTTQSSGDNTVNEATTYEETTQVQNRVDNVTETKETETAKATESSTQEETSAEEETTQEPTMEQTDTNTPYKSFYKYPIDETVCNGYTEELVYNETMGDYRAHSAVDFTGEAGCEVGAINDGLVLSVTEDGLLGTVVEIDHGGKLMAKYCGLDTVTVSEGDYVTIGSSIGTLGTVPFESQEIHLHLETTLDGVTVNPLDVMGKTE